MSVSNRIPTTRQRNLRGRSPAGRGFTLVELMVAMTGAVFISVAVFTLARDVTNFFQTQYRLSETTGTAINGFERLRQDIQRAAFLASPNLTRDANRCPRPTTAGSAAAAPVQGGGTESTVLGWVDMAMANIVTDANATVTGNAQMTQNGLSPEVLTLWGNYTSTEEFPARSVDLANRFVYLEPTSAAMIRAGMVPANTAAVNELILQNIFVQNRLVRLADGTSRDQYALISAVSWNSGVPRITLSATIPLVSKATNSFCGIRGSGTDLTINPVDIVQYRLDSLAADTNYTNLYTTGGPPYDAGRLELVRRELNPTDYSVLRQELVVEYAVDLRFGLTVMSDPVTGTLTYLPEGHANIPLYAGSTTDAAEAGSAGFFGPQMIRGIHARLAIRNRFAEYDAPAVAGTPADDALFRVQVSANGPYAIVRSLRSHIATRNTQNLLWN